MRERTKVCIWVTERERECVHFCDGKEKQEITSKIEREREIESKKEYVCVCERAF